MAKPMRPWALPELWILTALSTALHVSRLWTPRAVVFDELYYVRFAGDYLTGSYLFDVHPPLARLMYAGLACLLHLDPTALANGAPAPELRLLPALFGTALVPLMFVLLRQLGASRPVATLGATAVLLDNALLVVSRLALPEILLIAFGIGAFSSFLAARTRSGWRRPAFLGAAALLAGAALSVKWTGASALGVVLAAWFIESIAGRRPLAPIVREGALLVLIPAAVYLGAWAIHFALLDHSGPGDRFMSVRFQSQLPGAALYDPRAPRLSFVEKFADVHHAIRYGNGQLQNVTNPGASPWYTWPVMKHPMPLWEGPSAQRTPGWRSSMILIGNPLVWWGALVGTLFGISLFARRRKRFAGREYGFLLLFGGALLNYLPFIAIQRVMYIYHYLFALTFAIGVAALSLGAAFKWQRSGEAPDDSEARWNEWRFESRTQALAYVGIIAALFAAFIYFLPFTYGWTLSDAAWNARFWVLHPTF